MRKQEKILTSKNIIFKITICFMITIILSTSCTNIIVATTNEIDNKEQAIQKENENIQINNKTQIITPTPKGEAIYDVVNKTMPDMLNPKLTASWEKGLDMVAKKEIPPNEFMTKLEAYVNSKFDKLVMR